MIHVATIHSQSTDSLVPSEYVPKAHSFDGHDKKQHFSSRMIITAPRIAPSKDKQVAVAQKNKKLWRPSSNR